MAKSNKSLRTVFIVILVIIFLLFLWICYISGFQKKQTKEGFGKDSKLTLSYNYTNTLSDTGLKIFTMNDTMLNSSNDKIYVPLIMTISDDVIRSPVIDMSLSDPSNSTLYVILQPHKPIVNLKQDSMPSYADNRDFGWKKTYKDFFPVTFDFQISIDLKLHSNYVVNLTPPNSNITVQNKIIKNKSKSIGLINLGSNSLHIYGEGDIIDDSRVKYGNIKKKLDDVNDPSYLIYDINMTNMYANLNSIVVYFGNLIPLVIDQSNSVHP